MKKPSLPTVQFAAAMYYANEESGYAVVEVMRIGSSSLIEAIGGTSVVYWETEDSSAKAGLFIAII